MEKVTDDLFIVTSRESEIERLEKLKEERLAEWVKAFNNLMASDTRVKSLKLRLQYEESQLETRINQEQIKLDSYRRAVREFVEAEDNK